MKLAEIIATITRPLADSPLEPPVAVFGLVKFYDGRAFIAPLGTPTEGREHAESRGWIEVDRDDAA